MYVFQAGMRDVCTVGMYTLCKMFQAGTREYIQLVYTLCMFQACMGECAHIVCINCVCISG